MTTATSPLKTESAIVIIKDKAMAQKVLGAELVKQEIAKQAAICKEMIVNDESSAQVAQQQLTILNKMQGTVEKKRKELKRPFHEAGKFIDAVAAELTGEAEAVIKEGKKKIQDYHNTLVKTNEAVVAETKEQAEEETIKAELTAEKRFEAIDAISKWFEEAFTKFSNCKTLEELKEQFSIYCWKNGAEFPMKQFNVLSAEAIELKKRLVVIKDMRKDSIVANNLLAAETDEEKQIDMQEGLLTMARNLLKTKKESSAYFKTVYDKICAEKEIQIENATAEVVKAETAVATSNVPKFEWDYEVVNFEKVSNDFKMINSSAVEKYIKENINNLANGEVRDGIKFVRSVKQVRLA